MQSKVHAEGAAARLWHRRRRGCFTRSTRRACRSTLHLTFVATLGPVECVARARYVLLRSHRVFADVIVMRDAVRLAIHLHRAANPALFIKHVSDGTRFTVVAKLRSVDELEAMRPFLVEAYEQSLA
ncbi:DUF5655 domain-containing protein [Xanthomonas campestris pv. parthenii]|nr:DUF5655 domain-containing protein [Xanthomonas campestris]MCC4603264.1 DUF5655 domain-containing protein [Xanthomonas campestris pv. parthenii]